MKKEIISIPKKKVFAYDMHHLNNNIFNEDIYSKVPYGYRKKLHVRSGSKQDKMIHQLLTLNSEKLKKENVNAENENNIVLPNIDLNNGTVLKTDVNDYDKNLNKNYHSNKDIEDLKNRYKLKLNSETIFPLEQINSADDNKMKIQESTTINTLNYESTPKRNSSLDFDEKQIKSSDTVNNLQNTNLPPKIPNYHTNYQKPQIDNQKNLEKTNTLDSELKLKLRNYSADEVGRRKKIESNEQNEILNNLPEIKNDSRKQSKCGNEVLYFHDHENFNNKLIKTLEIQKNRVELFKNNVMKKNIEKENDLKNFIDKQVIKGQEKDFFEYNNFWQHRKDIEKIHSNILKMQMNEKFKKQEESKMKKQISKSILVHDVNLYFL